MVIQKLYDLIQKVVAYFLYFNIKNDTQIAEYYEIRDIKGNLIERKENIEKCYQQFKLV